MESPPVSPRLNRKQACMTPEQIREKLKDYSSKSQRLQDACMEHMLMFHSFAPPQNDHLTNVIHPLPLTDDDNDNPRTHTPTNTPVMPPTTPKEVNVDNVPSLPEPSEPKRRSSYLEHLEFCAP